MTRIRTGPTTINGENIEVLTYSKYLKYDLIQYLNILQQLTTCTFKHNIKNLIVYQSTVRVMLV